MIAFSASARGVARAFGLPIKSITLFVFGGVAEMEGEPKAPLAELLMAVAGPIASVLLGIGFLVLAGLVPPTAPPEYQGVLHYLGVLNFTLAAFNMAPAFPLDGGRVLRALIWLFTGDALLATRIAARSGEVIGLLLIGLGGLAALTNGLGRPLVGRPGLVHLCDGPRAPERSGSQAATFGRAQERWREKRLAAQPLLRSLRLPNRASPSKPRSSACRRRAQAGSSCSIAAGLPAC